MKLYHLKIAVVQAFKEGGKLGIAVISHIKVGETLSQEIPYFCKDNRLVLAVVLPVLAVYYLVYHSYAPEFFLIAVDTGVGVAAMLVIHRALVSANHTWMSTVAVAGTAVLALIQIGVTASLRRKKGKFTFRGSKIDTRFSKNAYLMLTITPIVMVALTAVVVLAASHVMIALGAAAAYLFITAVYYTVKLM